MELALKKALNQSYGTMKKGPVAGLNRGVIGHFPISFDKDDRDYIKKVQYSDYVLAVSRDVDDPDVQCVYMAKNRYSGETGQLDPEQYDAGALKMLIETWLHHSHRGTDFDFNEITRVLDIIAKKDDPKYKKLYDQLMFVHGLCE